MAKWWEDKCVETVDWDRGRRGVRVSFHPGDGDEEGQEPLLQLAFTWRPDDGEGDRVPLKSQPTLLLSDLLNQPEALELLRRFVEMADVAMTEEAII